MAPPKHLHRSRSAIALAVFAATLAGGTTDADAAGLLLLQVTPAQDFTPSDGRAMDVPAWRIDARIAQQVIAAFDATRQPLVIDYEHQTLNAEVNGQPAPAAGWMRALRWVDGRGLFAEVELTARARELVAGGEYRYFSPVLEYSRESGAIKRVLMGALTNNPAIHGMEAVNLLAAASARFTSNPEDSVNPLLEKLLSALGLPADASEDAALQAVASIKAELQAAYKELDIDDQTEAGAEGIAAACAKLRTAPDAARFVPVTVVDELKTSLAALTAKQHQREREDVIASALADGRLLPAEEAWARELAATPAGLASLSGLLAVRQPIAALAGTQTQGQPPAGKPAAHGLTEAELAVARACGLTPEAYASGKA